MESMRTTVIAVWVLVGAGTAMACGDFRGVDELQDPAENPTVRGEVAGIHFEAAGQGAAVVLIHGGALDSRMWDRQFELLSREFLVLRYDIRGFGRSEPPREPFSHVDDLVAVLDEAGVPTASLVGLSLGGAIALNFALVHPDRTDRLLLAGPAVPGASVMPEEPERFQRIGRLAAEGRMREAVEEWLTGTHMASAMANPDIAPTIRALAMDNKQSWNSRWVSSTPVTPPASRRLHEVQVPTAVLVGGQDDRSVRQQAELVAAGVPGARIDIVPGAGHIANIEAPEAFDRWLLEALKMSRGDGA